MFGSLAYAHVPSELRQKLDEKAEAMVMVGYNLKSKGYRLYNPKDGRVVVSRYVIFDENKLGLPALANRQGENNSETFTSDLPSTTKKPIPLRRSERTNSPVIRYGVNHVLIMLLALLVTLQNQYQCQKLCL